MVAANPGVTATPDGAAVPEFPVLAPGVEVCGQLQGSGFADKQWLIQRDGRYLQVTAVLYHIAEAATGANSIEAIAASISAATRRAVNPDQVRMLLEKQLIPARIVASATPGADSAPQRGAPSALAVTMRLGVVGPRHIEPVTRFLQYLYWPPVVVVILLTAAAGHVWLYLVHGAGGSVQGALTAPGALLAALGIFIVSACFHEIGHAAALRYAGGNVRGMGMGMYLLYPVFYTDVTDSYRFGRAARVRTDLGGFYFNLIFALGMLALYAATGAELLLLVVVLTNFDILRQSLPFVRMDGYWVLADLTGIPDLFTHLPAFVRSKNPFRRDVGSTSRFRMKGWVAACFVLYFAITVPLLVTALFFMVRNLPHVISSAAASFADFGRLFWTAFEAHEFLIAAGTAAQSAVLGVTVLGLLYALGRVAFDVGRGLWRWGRPSAERRAVALAAGTSMAALVVSLWLPQVPWPQLGTTDSLAVRAAIPALAEAFTAPGIAGGPSPEQEVTPAAVESPPPPSSPLELGASPLSASQQPPSAAMSETGSTAPPAAVEDASSGSPIAGPAAAVPAAGSPSTSGAGVVRPAPPAPATPAATPALAVTFDSSPPAVAAPAVPPAIEVPAAPSPTTVPPLATVAASVTPTAVGVLESPALPPVSAAAAVSVDITGLDAQAEIETSISLPPELDATVAVGLDTPATEDVPLSQATTNPVPSVVDPVVGTIETTLAGLR